MRPRSSSMPVERRLMRRLLANSAGLVELIVIVTVGGVSGVEGSATLGASSTFASFSFTSFIFSFIFMLNFGNFIVQQVVSVSLLEVFVNGVSLCVSLESFGVSALFTFIIILLKSFSEEFEEFCAVKQITNRGQNRIKHNKINN